MSRKSERLVNLTIALLATRRYLTKSEIFNTVAGYSGDAEAKDRMFERDKEDLRSLGIAIELGTFDPLFEDEAGYRIKPESYSLQLIDLDTTSLAILSHASKMWRDSALGESAQSGLRKLKGIGLDSDLTAVAGIAPTLHSVPSQLSDLVEGITEKRSISFQYRNEDLVSETRHVNPYRISNSGGSWYLIGFDLLREAIRTYRLDRFASEVEFTSKGNHFTIDESLIKQVEESRSILQEAFIAVRKGTHHPFTHSKVIEEDEDWMVLDVQYLDEERLIFEILGLGLHAYVRAPETLRNRIIKSLEEGIALHG